MYQLLLVVSVLPSQQEGLVLARVCEMVILYGNTFVKHTEHIGNIVMMQQCMGYHATI